LTVAVPIQHRKVLITFHFIHQLSQRRHCLLDRMGHRY